MSIHDQIYDAITSLEELRQDVQERVDEAIELLRASLNADAPTAGTAEAVARVLGGEVLEERAEALTWYPAQEHIEQVRERYPGVISDAEMRELTSRFIRWHENKLVTLPYKGASQHWLRWVIKEAQRKYELSLASNGLDSVVRSDTHRRASPADVDDTADRARELAEQEAARTAEDKNPVKP